MTDEAFDGFADYYVTTAVAPAIFVVLVTLVVILSIVLVAPFACLGSHRSNPSSGKLNKSGVSEPSHAPSHLPHGTAASTSSSCSAEREHHHSLPRINSHSQPPANGSTTGSKLNHSMLQSMEQPQPVRARRHRIEERPNVADLTIFHRELLNAMKILATERRYGAAAPPSGDLLLHSDPPPMTSRPFYHATTPAHTSALSAIPSVATTSRLREPRKKRPFRSRMPWGRDQNPQPRLERMQQAVWLERQAAYSEGGSVHNSHAARSQGSRHSAAASGWPKSRIVSTAATHVLEAEALDGEADYYRQRWQHRRSHSNVSGSDVGSVMPPLSPSVVSPQDAADANDPGRIPNPTQFYSSNSVSSAEDSEKLGWKRLLGHLLDLAEINFESRRIVSLAVGPTINAMAEPLFRMVLVAIISHFIDTDSMVAYVLVILFLRISTIEISGAIADAESNMLQDAFFQLGGVAGLYQAGRVIQLSIVVQVLIGVPVLLMWFFVMNPLVQWLVDDSHIARVASSYTGVIMIDYLIRSASRSFMLPFHLTGQAQFEKNIDLMASFLTVVAIAIVATNFDLSLTAIGWIQVILGIAKALTKVAYVIFKGLIVPYHDGLVKSWACKVCIVCNCRSTFTYSKSKSLTLLLSSFTGHCFGCHILVTSFALISGFTVRTRRVGSLGALCLALGGCGSGDMGSHGWHLGSLGSHDRRTRGSRVGPSFLLPRRRSAT
jgi:hypothetical protein